MEIGEFLDGCRAIGASHPQRAATLADAVSVVYARAARRARRRLSTITDGLVPVSLTASLTDTQRARPLPALSAEDLGLDGFGDELTEGVSPHLKAAALAILALLGVDQLSHRAERRVDAQIARLDVIGDATRLRIGDAIATARADGLTIGEAVDIVGILDDMAVSTAADVGHGEATALDGGLTQATVLDEGLAAFKVWLTVQDDRVRPDHDDADGQAVDAGDFFEVGGEALAFPRDPDGSPEETMNCRCYVGWADSLDAAESGDFVALTMGDEGSEGDQSAPG